VILRYPISSASAHKNWLRALRTAGRCSVAALAMTGCHGGTTPAGAIPARPNVLLVTIDTWRADRLGAGISPALDQLAASAIRFTAARTAAPLTLPAHTTILTGLLPPVHGVRVNGLDVLNSSHPTIARLLKDSGYRTAAFIGAFVLDRRYGLAAGFDAYDDRIPRDPRASERLEAERPASAVIDGALGWLDSHAGTSVSTATAAAARATPFFVWIHLYDPHAPYNPPPEFLERVKHVNVSDRGRSESQQTMYDGEIAYADSQLSRVLSWLQTRGLAGRTLIVVAGDHGEGLGEHGEQTHGMLLYDSTLRVPLVVAAPGRQAAVRDEAVSLADIAPTILAAAGVSRPDAMKGRDLLDDIKADGEVRLKPDLYSETDYPRAAGWSPLHALTDGRWMTIRAGSAMELYDLHNDPRQLHDIAISQQSIANAMSARIEAIRGGAGKTGPSAREVSRDAEERLRALGYVASGTQAPIVTNAMNPASVIEAWNRFEDALTALHARRPDAVAALEQLAREHPESPVFQTTAARAMKDAGKLDRALATYRRAARRWPTDPMLFHDLAVAARDASQAAQGVAARSLRAEAMKAERVALALSPNSAVAHNGLGLLAVDEGRTQEAAAEFERASAMDPNNASYLANLGNARRALGDRAAAEQAYRLALNVSPQTADAANGLGVLLVEAQRPAEAVAWFDRALAAAPDFAEARLNLGIALQESGQASRAAEQYRQVLAARGAPREKEAATKLLAAMQGAGREKR
jgi:choline-sulfatase